MVDLLIIDLLLMLDDTVESTSFVPLSRDEAFLDFRNRAQTALARHLRHKAKSEFPQIYLHPRRRGHDAPAAYDFSESSVMTQAELEYYFPDLAKKQVAPPRRAAQPWSVILGSKPDTAAGSFFARFFAVADKQFLR